MIAAERAIRDWLNGRTDLVGAGMPLARGAYVLSQRSPGDGAYGIVARNPEGAGVDPVAETSAIIMARMQVMVFAGTTEAAEFAAAAVRVAFESLTGAPERCPGDTGVTVMVADNHDGPFYVPGTAEPYCFQVGADFMLTELGRD